MTEYFSRAVAESLLDDAPVEVPCGKLGTVRVRRLSGEDRLAYLDSIMGRSAYQTAHAEGIADMAMLAIRCVIDENGEPVFGAEDFDLAVVAITNGLSKAVNVAAEINGFRVEADAGKSEPSPS